jgi:adenylate cyclase
VPATAYALPSDASESGLSGAKRLAVFSSATITEGKKAVSLDPVSTEAARVLGEDYYFSHRYPAAIAQLRETVSMDPDYWFAHVALGRAYLYSGKTREAVAELKTANRFAPDNPDSMASLGNAYAVAGTIPQAKDVLAKLQTLSSRGVYVAPYHQAIVYLGLGDKTRALELLEEDFRQRSIFVSWWNTDPALDPLRSDARFKNLIRLSPLFGTTP